MFTAIALKIVAKFVVDNTIKELIADLYTQRVNFTHR
jgi:hypothetical protein